MIKQYFKINVWNWLYGDIRHDFTAEQRGIFLDLLAFACISPAPDGVIRISRETICKDANITPEQLEGTIQAGMRDVGDNGRSRIELNDMGFIVIANWNKYQRGSKE